MSPKKKMEVCIMCVGDSYGRRDMVVGFDDMEAIKAVGRYFLARHREGFSPGDPWGWMPVCADDVPVVKRLGYPVEPLKGFENHRVFKKMKPITSDGPYDHDWEKRELVTNEDGTNTWHCIKCGDVYVQHGIFMDDRPDEGCHIKEGRNVI